MSELGRLKRSLKQRCPDCNHVLQIRIRENVQMVRGEDILEETDYIVCSAECGYESEIKEQKKRKERLDKTAYVKPVENDRRDKNAKYPKRDSTSKNYGGKGENSFGKRNK